MSAVEAGDAVVELVAGGVFGELVDGAAGEVAKGVAAEDIAADEDDVDGEDDGADADAEVAVEPEGLPDVIDQERPDDVGEAEEVAVEVLGDEWKGFFAEVGFTGFADGAGDGVHPEGFVVCAAVVVTGEAEEAGDPEDEEGRREGKEAGVPGGFGAEHGVGRGAEEFGGVEGGDVGAEGVIGVLEGGPVGVDEEASEAEEDEEGGEPPVVAALGLEETSVFDNNVGG